MKFLLYYTDEDGGGWFEVVPVGIFNTKKEATFHQQEISKKAIEYTKHCEKVYKKNQQIFLDFVVRNKYCIRQKTDKFGTVTLYKSSTDYYGTKVPCKFTTAVEYIEEVILTAKYHIVPTSYEDYTQHEKKFITEALSNYCFFDVDKLKETLPKLIYIKYWKHEDGIRYDNMEFYIEEVEEF